MSTKKQLFYFIFTCTMITLLLTSCEHTVAKQPKEYTNIKEFIELLNSPADELLDNIQLFDENWEQLPDTKILTFQKNKGLGIIMKPSEFELFFIDESSNRTQMLESLKQLDSMPSKNGAKHDFKYKDYFIMYLNSPVKSSMLITKTDF